METPTKEEVALPTEDLNSSTLSASTGKASLKEIFHGDRRHRVCLICLQNPELEPHRRLGFLDENYHDTWFRSRPKLREHIRMPLHEKFGPFEGRAYEAILDPISTDMIVSNRAVSEKFLRAFDEKLQVAKSSGKELAFETQGELEDFIDSFLGSVYRLTPSTSATPTTPAFNKGTPLRPTPGAEGEDEGSVEPAAPETTEETESLLEFTPKRADPSIAGCYSHDRSVPIEVYELRKYWWWIVKKTYEMILSQLEKKLKREVKSIEEELHAYITSINLDYFKRALSRDSWVSGFCRDPKDFNGKEYMLRAQILPFALQFLLGGSDHESVKLAILLSKLCSYVPLSLETNRLHDECVETCKEFVSFIEKSIHYKPLSKDKKMVQVLELYDKLFPVPPEGEEAPPKPTYGSLMESLTTNLNLVRYQKKKQRIYLPGQTRSVISDTPTLAKLDAELPLGGQRVKDALRTSLPENSRLDRVDVYSYCNDGKFEEKKCTMNMAVLYADIVDPTQFHVGILLRVLQVHEGRASQPRFLLRPLIPTGLTSLGSPVLALGSNVVASPRVVTQVPIVHDCLRGGCTISLEGDKSVLKHTLYPFFIINTYCYRESVQPFKETVFDSSQYAVPACFCEHVQKARSTSKKCGCPPTVFHVHNCRNVHPEGQGCTLDCMIYNDYYACLCDPPCEGPCPNYWGPGFHYSNPLEQVSQMFYSTTPSVPRTPAHTPAHTHAHAHARGVYGSDGPSSSTPVLSLSLGTPQTLPSASLIMTPVPLTPVPLTPVPMPSLSTGLPAAKRQKTSGDQDGEETVVDAVGDHVDPSTVEEEEQVNVVQMDD